MTHYSSLYWYKVHKASGRGCTCATYGDCRMCADARVRRAARREEKARKAFNIGVSTIGAITLFLSF